ncbi:YafY family protein [Paenibacillus hodogayensis]|uniref:YafY family protein n=1 Tax=Paenibacillus hodogayensis TaxID=279208 RepID=A0ABV5W465_9BACL
MAKADNMLAILWLLKSRGRVTARELAEELELHIRTVYRNIDALCVSGVPIVAEPGRDGGYSIPDSVKLEPLFFDLDEQKSLVQAAAFAREAGYPDLEALERAVAKIKRYSNPRQLEALERQETSMEAIHPPTAPALAEMLSRIDSAVERQTSLVIGYRSGYDGPLRERTIDPYGLVYWKSKWYVVGYCRLREAIRSFRVDRMGSIGDTELEFRRPPQFSARAFLLDGLLPEAGSEEEDRLVSVRIEGSPQALDDIAAHWLWGHALVERTAGSAHFRMEEAQLYTQMPYYLLSFGGTIRVCEPRELQACLADIAASLLDYYRADL